MRAVGALGTIAVILALAPATASAETWTVQEGAGACGGGNTACGTLSQAASAAGPGDTILITPGTYAESPTFAAADLTVSGTGAGSAVILGTVTFTRTARLNRVVVRPGGDAAAIRVNGAPLDPDKALTIDSTILSGEGSGAGISSSTSPGAGSITINARHVTIADRGSAPATSLSPVIGSPVTANFSHSIVLGARQGTGTVNEVNTDSDNSPAHRAALFVEPGAESFFLRAGSPAIDQGGALAGDETAVDVEGQPRPAGAANDRGADEWVNHPPTAPALVQGPAATVLAGQPVGFVALGAVDFDAPRGGAVVGYRFDFGDGSPVLETASSSVVRPYTAPGTYTATVRAVDNGDGIGGGAESPRSNAVTTRVVAAGFAGPRGPDVTPPRVLITSPRNGQRLRLGRSRLTLRGRASDTSGVRRVELALRRRQGRGCRWYDGRRTFRLGRCDRPRFFRATLADFAWRYTFPRAVRPAPGRYDLRVRATDAAGNTTRAFSAGSRTLVAFRLVR